MNAVLESTRPTPARGSLFQRILVGIDGSPESIEAARQGARLLGRGGTLTLLAIQSLAPPVGGLDGALAPAYVDADAEWLFVRETLAEARAALDPSIEPVAKIARGSAGNELLAEASGGGHTLLAVGTHGMGRLRGIVSGSTATEILHTARCSVLVARSSTCAFPRKIVVGVDGSPQSATAYAVASGLADRFGGELWPVVAVGAKVIERSAVRGILGRRREDPADEPVTAILAASADADLVVVGSRGLHGWRALGSVSERVAHEARCSTLVVRQFPSPA